MSNRAPVVLFDLDGTLADPGTSIVSSVARALEQLGERVPSADQLRGFVGPPLVDTFASLGVLADADEPAALRNVLTGLLAGSAPRFRG